MPPAKKKGRGKGASNSSLMDSSVVGINNSTKKTRARKTATAPSVQDDVMVGLLNSISDQMSMMNDRVSDMEARMQQQDDTIVSSPVAQAVPPKRTTKRHQLSSPDDISAEVGRKVAKRLRSVSMRESISSGVGSSSDEDDTSFTSTPQKKKGKPKKSGRLRNAESDVKVTVQWPHEVIYTSEGSPTDYDQLSIPQFVRGFTIIMMRAKPAITALMGDVLAEIMEDAETYAWARVRAAHGVFLQRIEAGQSDWSDESARAKIRRTFVWNYVKSSTFRSKTSPNKSHPSSFKPTTTQPTTFQPKIMAKPGTKACTAYNKATCSNPEDHPDREHICSYCLVKEKRSCTHPQICCLRQQRDLAALNGKQGGQ